MKRILYTTCLLTLFAWASGCGKKAETEGSGAQPGDLGEVLQKSVDSARESVARKAEEAQDAVRREAEELKSQAMEKVEAAKAETRDAIDARVRELGRQFTESLKETGDGFLQRLGFQVNRKASGVADALKESAIEPAREAIGSLMTSLKAGRDSRAIGSLDAFDSHDFTEQQRQRIEDFRKSLGAFVVQRNFSSLKGSENDIARIAEAMLMGDGETAVAGLKEVAAKAQLSAEQKEVLASLVAEYAPDLEALRQSAHGAMDRLRGVGNEPPKRVTPP